MVPPAPPIFSIMMDWPRIFDIWLVTMRATTSLAPPAGNGTITVIGRDGYSCACAGTMPASKANTRTIEGQTLDFMTPCPWPRAVISFGHCPISRRPRPGAPPAPTKCRRAPPRAMASRTRPRLHAGPARAPRRQIPPAPRPGCRFCVLDHHGLAFAAPEETKPIVQIVIGGRIPAVDVHQIVLGRRGLARVQRRQRAVVV